MFHRQRAKIKQYLSAQKHKLPDLILAEGTELRDKKPFFTKPR